MLFCRRRLLRDAETRMPPITLEVPTLYDDPRHFDGFFFEGTIVNIGLRCDDSYYCLSSETTPPPLS